MELNKKRKNIYFYAGAILLVIIDQITKIVIKNYFAADFAEYHYVNPVSIIGDFLQITFVENEGMAFGITFGSAKIFLSLFRIIASVLLVYYLHKIKDFSPFVKFGIMLILAGAVGNLIDSVFYGVLFNESPLFYGRVVDFILVDIPDISFFGREYTHWPVWNIADACVTVGVIFLAIFHKKLPSFTDVFPKKKKSQTKTEMTNSIL